MITEEYKKKIAGLSANDQNNEFFEQAILNKLEEVEYILSSNPSSSFTFYEFAICMVASRNHKETVLFLIENADKYKQLSNIIAAEHAVRISCQDENINLLLQLLESIKKFKIEENYLVNYAFSISCAHGKKKAVEVLMTHPKYKSVIDVKKGFDTACNTAQLEVVKYFLGFPESKSFYESFKEKRVYFMRSMGHENSVEYLKFCLKDEKVRKNMKLHKDISEFVCHLFEYVTDNPKNLFYMDALNYLVFEYGVKKTVRMTKEMSKYPDIKKMFKVREINNILNNELVNKEELPNKLSISKKKI